MAAAALTGRREKDVPRFSVIVPTYNRAARLRATLGSVLSQTFQDFELLVMDDGSTDDSRRAVEELNDARIKYSWASNSGGPATPRNRGIEAAAGEWLCFLDADDVWYPEKLAVVDQAIAADPAADVICNNEYMVLRQTGRKKKLSYGPFGKDFYRSTLIEGNRCSTSATCVRHAFLDSHGLRFNVAANYVVIEDYDLWLRLALAGARFKYIDRVLGEYLIEADSISLNRKRAIDNLEVVLRNHVFELQKFASDRERLWDQISVRVQLIRARHLAGSGCLGAAARLALASIAKSPSGASVYLVAGIKRGFRGMFR